MPILGALRIVGSSIFKLAGKAANKGLNVGSSSLKSSSKILKKILKKSSTLGKISLNKVKKSLKSGKSDKFSDSLNSLGVEGKKNPNNELNSFSKLDSNGISEIYSELSPLEKISNNTLESITKLVGGIINLTSSANPINPTLKSSKEKTKENNFKIKILSKLDKVVTFSKDTTFKVSKIYQKSKSMKASERFSSGLNNLKDIGKSTLKRITNAPSNSLLTTAALIGAFLSSKALKFIEEMMSYPGGAIPFIWDSLNETINSKYGSWGGFFQNVFDGLGGLGSLIWNSLNEKVDEAGGWGNFLADGIIGSVKFANSIIKIIASGADAVGEALFGNNWKIFSAMVQDSWEQLEAVSKLGLDSLKLWWKHVEEDGGIIPYLESTVKNILKSTDFGKWWYEEVQRDGGVIPYLEATIAEWWKNSIQSLNFDALNFRSFKIGDSLKSLLNFDSVIKPILDRREINRKEYDKDNLKEEIREEKQNLENYTLQSNYLDEVKKIDNRFDKKVLKVLRSENSTNRISQINKNSIDVKKINNSVKNYPLKSSFNKRIDVKSISEGIVISKTFNSETKKYVVGIKDKNGNIIMYSNIDVSNLKEGDKVYRGQKIAKSSLIFSRSKIDRFTNIENDYQDSFINVYNSENKKISLDSYIDRSKSFSSNEVTKSSSLNIKRSNTSIVRKDINIERNEIKSEILEKEDLSLAPSLIKLSEEVGKLKSMKNNSLLLSTDQQINI